MDFPPFITLDDISLKNKRVLIRVDFNVPVSNGRIDDDTRIRAGIPCIEKILAGHGRPIIMSHLGRPDEGVYDEALSLQPVATRLAQLLNREVILCRNLDELADLEDGPVTMLENVRFEKGEKENDDNLARRLAGLCDVYVNDAFATAHRAQSSTHGVAKYAPVACAGPLLLGEMDALGRALQHPQRPLVAVVAGAKVSTKLSVLENLLQKVDKLIVGGGIANTFLLATGHNTGKSLVETGLVTQAKRLVELARQQNKVLPLPVDVVCAREISADAEACVRPVGEVGDDDLILDVGPETAARYSEHLATAATILWNGPLGVFEIDQFAAGTESLARAIAASPAYSIAGGGDTLSAIARFGVTDAISYISTGGGAFLELLEGKTLPAIDILHECARARFSMELARDL